jgi:predicted transcriptional regulator
MAKWTPEEDAHICELRTRGAELDAIAQRFPHRSRGAVAKRVQHLIFEGQVERRGRPRANERWTVREDALIGRERARGATSAVIAAQFPNRTEDAVLARIRHLVESGNVTKRRHFGLRKAWSADDERLLEKMRRQRKTMAEMAAVLGRSVAAVNGRIATMIRSGELDVQQPHRPWTAEEDRRIATLRRRGKTAAEIAEALGRTRVSLERHIAAKLSKRDQQPVTRRGQRTQLQE